MKYEVRCECGKAHRVAGTDAGTSLRCPCGQTVEVPSLHQLRTAAGEFGVPPELMLSSLLANEFAEASTNLHRAALTEVALILLLMSLLFNITARWLVVGGSARTAAAY